jgi:hypothetical protein
MPVPEDMARALEVPAPFPSRAFLLEYHGSSRGMELHAVQWHRGVEATSSHSETVIDGSVAKELAFGVRDERDQTGALHSEHRVAERDRRPDSAAPQRMGGSTSTDVGREDRAIKGRPWRVLESRGPVESTIGQEAVLCAILIGGDPKDDDRVPPGERVRQVDDAWILSVRMQERK